MNVFLSYDSDRQARAETIAQRLEAAGHVVFFDRDDLAPGDAYDRRIADAVAAADAMVFLANEAAVAPGAYALSELALAEARWPHPEGRLIGVVLDGLDIAALPAYLRSVSVLQPRGDVAAEVVKARFRPSSSSAPYRSRPGSSVASRSGRRRMVLALPGACRCTRTRAPTPGSLWESRCCLRLDW